MPIEKLINILQRFAAMDGKTHEVKIEDSSLIVYEISVAYEIEIK